MDIKANNNWHLFDEGKSLGKAGSESGIIVFDIEHSRGARITLEHKTHIAPYATTLGIYGLMFHTHYNDSEPAAKIFIEQVLEKINILLEMLDVPENNQDDAWKEKFNNLTGDLAE